MRTERGLFISLEGGEGAGKGTQLKLLQADLDSKGVRYINVREPGGTQIGEKIREILLHLEVAGFSPEAELLLYGAARAQIVKEIIIPTLSSGVHVLCDRFYDSTTAYQGFGRGLDHKFIAAMREFATGGVNPDVTALFDIDPAKGLARATTENADRIESEDLAFHQRVREGYLWVAQNEPERVKVIDASGTPGEVYTRFLPVLPSRLFLPN